MLLRNLIMLYAVLLSSCVWEQKPIATQQQARLDYDLLLHLPAEPVSYEKRIKPILERRCVVCHGCYDAPCQLKLSSPEGILRGADKRKVYDGARILPMQPTRLFIDAKSTEEWRSKGFTPVLNETPSDNVEENLQQSLLYRMLRLKQLHPQPRVGLLPESFDIGLDRAQKCPAPDEFDRFARNHPSWGMPYAMPNLEDEEYASLVIWLAQGSPMPAAAGVSPQAAASVREWEQFLNGDSLKQRLMARYVYEHLFLAHVHLHGTPAREFYRLVRSRTPSGEAVDEVATLRPYEDPGARFYYRLLRYHPSIVAKDHVVYELSAQRLQRYRELFLAPDYTVTQLPGYDDQTASNPFKTFEPIPPASRYRFLLDDARFFIEGFIKGPVCRGQVALNVIEDQFWVMFFNPERQLIGTNPDFLAAMSDYLQLPVERGDTLNIFSIWTDYWERQRRYMSAREASFKQIHARDLEDALDYIWDGEGRNPNAALTVFRHFDSASVSYGLLGDYPETAWIIDYPLLERIHYLLVAGFNVYGNVGHQLNTRLYMDFLRMEGENHFLVFLPTRQRKAIRDSWYQGARSMVQEAFNAPSDWLQVESVIGFTSDDPQRELYHHLEKRLAMLARLEFDLDRCGEQSCLLRRARSPAEARADRAMQRIAAIHGEHLDIFPEVSFVRVKAASGDLAYSLIHNKAYKNVTSMLAEAKQRDPEDKQLDTLTVLKWLEGSYPNFFFEVDLARMEDFVARYAAIRHRRDYEAFVALYGVRRTNQRFWQVADWFHQQYAREQPILSGVYDLYRYRNR